MSVSSCAASLSLCCSLLPHSHSATHLFLLHQPSPRFDLGDPYCRYLRTEYNILHDPHLQDYHNRKDNLQNLKNRGLVTKDGNVGLEVGFTNTGVLRRGFQAAGRGLAAQCGVPMALGRRAEAASPRLGRGGEGGEEQLPAAGACTLLEGCVGSYVKSGWESSALVSV